MPTTPTPNKYYLAFSRPLLWLCAGILLASILSAAICQRLVASSLENRTAQYGQALADLAARQAMDSTLNHDLVSLQVILSDITTNPDVTNASIHDVENNLLVQAGAARRPSRAQASFSAAIALHDSVAGYVTVNLDLSNDWAVRYQLFWLFGFMAVLLIALTLSALYFGRSWNLPAILQRPSIPIVSAPPKKAEPEDEPAGQPFAPIFPRVELIIHFHNLRELAGQLDHRAFRNVSRRIEEQFRSILALYRGQLIQFDGDEARLAFANPQTDPDAAFQAVCSAKLLQTLNAKSKPFSLGLSTLVVQRDSDGAILKNLQFQLAELDDYRQILRRSPSGTLLMERRLMADEGLAAKLKQNPVDDFADLVEVPSLNEPYAGLIDRQLDQLQHA